MGKGKKRPGFCVRSGNDATRSFVEVCPRGRITFTGAGGINVSITQSGGPCDPCGGGDTIVTISGGGGGTLLSSTSQIITGPTVAPVTLFGIMRTGSNILPASTTRGPGTQIRTQATGTFAVTAGTLSFFTTLNGLAVPGTVITTPTFTGTGNFTYSSVLTSTTASATLIYEVTPGVYATLQNNGATSINYTVPNTLDAQASISAAGNINVFNAMIQVM